jgi:hypothetical protein
MPDGNGEPYVAEGAPYGEGAVGEGGAISDGVTDVPPGLAEYGSNAGAPSVGVPAVGGSTLPVPDGG